MARIDHRVEDRRLTLEKLIAIREREQLDQAGGSQVSTIDNMQVGEPTPGTERDIGVA